MTIHAAITKLVVLIILLVSAMGCTDQELADALADLENASVAGDNTETETEYVPVNMQEVTLNEDHIIEASALDNCEREEEAMVCQLDLGDDVVINGSFEEGHNLGNNKWGVFQNLGSWTIDRDQRDAGIEVQNGQRIGGLAPAAGDAKVELDAHAKNGFSESDTHLYQELSVKENGTYLITFSYSPRAGAVGTSSGVTVIWDGQEIAELTASQVGWVEYKFVVSSTQDLAKIEFVAHEDNNTLGGYLDNVSIQEVLN